jgi:hypothetical protein
MPIFFPHTVVNPRTVMIISTHTFLTFMAMSGSEWLVYAAYSTIAGVSMCSLSFAR